jgi:SAM-dependent methyltransferase
MQVLPTAQEIRDANARYHDVAAASYDAKWGIDFGEIGQAQVLGKLRKTVGGEPDGHYERALEVGAGTGYFSLNLLQAGVVGEAVCTDISPGMVRALRQNARRLGLERVRAEAADAAQLPFGDGSFDLVLGHAVLHHLADLERCFGEFYRVLKPRGRIVFAGEPSRIGDRLARIPKRAACLIAPAWRAALRAKPAATNGDSHSGGRDGGDSRSPGQLGHELESLVDIHAFAPGELSELARRTSFCEVRVGGEELTAGWFGWFNRSLEASARRADVPDAWRQYAFHGYLALQRLDSTALEPHLPAAIFYNLLLTGRRPALRRRTLRGVRPRS